MSLVFVFFPLIEFALVLILNEVHEQRMGETNSKDTMLKSPIEFLGETTKPQSSQGKDSPFQEVRGEQKIILRTSGIGFIKDLPLVRKIDLLAFGTHLLAFCLFNLCYWTIF